ncbi:hypothetical protein P9112_010516 [Eukaryota sp. TZLM1-RC]
MNLCRDMIREMLLKSKDLRRTFFQTVFDNDDHDLLVCVRGQGSSQPLAENLLTFLLDLSDQLQYPSTSSSIQPNICFGSSNNSSNNCVMGNGKVFVSMSNDNKNGLINDSGQSENLSRAKFVFDMVRGKMTMAFIKNSQPTYQQPSAFGQSSSFGYSTPPFGIAQKSTTTTAPTSTTKPPSITLCSIEYADLEKEGYIPCSEGDIIAIDIVSGELTVTNQRTEQKKTQSWTSSKTVSFTLNGRAVLRILD